MLWLTPLTTAEMAYTRAARFKDNIIDSAEKRKAECGVIQQRRGARPRRPQTFLFFDGVAIEIRPTATAPSKNKRKGSGVFQAISGVCAAVINRSSDNIDSANDHLSALSLLPFTFFLVPSTSYGNSHGPTTVIQR
jgi:hypothetical protein